MHKVLIAIACLAALAAVPAAGAATEQSAGPRPVTPARAQVLASTPGYALGSSAVPISKSDALAAMEQPGAATVLAPGYATPAQAVAASTGCTAWQSGWGWGTWPYDQELYDHTYYCVVAGVRITSRSTNVTTGGTLCGTEYRDNWLSGGGIGYAWMVVHVQARFSCPTAVPFLSLHPSDWLETSYNDWGNAAVVGHS